MMNLPPLKKNNVDQFKSLTKLNVKISKYTAQSQMILLILKLQFQARLSQSQSLAKKFLNQAMDLLGNQNMSN